MTFYPPIDWTDHPLHAAAFSGNPTKVKSLIDQGADVNELLHCKIHGPDLAGAPLHVALFNCGNDGGHHDAVRMLLAAGANVHLCRMWEGTPLHDAARFGLTHMAELMISSGAEVNGNGDYLGRTPLHLAAIHGRLTMVDFLLSAGADVDSISSGVGGDGARDSPYWRQYDPRSLERRFSSDPTRGTPLHMAAREGHVEVIKRLLEHGARLDTAAAIELARRSRSMIESKYDEMIALLQDITKGDA